MDDDENEGCVRVNRSLEGVLNAQPERLYLCGAQQCVKRGGQGTSRTPGSAGFPQNQTWSNEAAPAGGLCCRLGLVDCRFDRSFVNPRAAFLLKADRIFDQVHRVGQVQLFFDMSAMTLDGFHAQEE